MKQVDQSM